MQEAVDVAVQLKYDIIREVSNTENQQFLDSIDEGIKKTGSKMKKFRKKPSSTSAPSENEQPTYSRNDYHYNDLRHTKKSATQSALVEEAMQTTRMSLKHLQHQSLKQVSMMNKQRRGPNIFLTFHNLHDKLLPYHAWNKSVPAIH
ncbi:hypothetical protein Tco_1182088 [Tanacetum coccineum]